MLEALSRKEKLISVIGLGYVGLPLALELSKIYKVIGFDINEERVEMMRNGEDPSRELDSSAFENTDIYFTSDHNDLSKAHFHIVAVPTPVDQRKVPNLKPVLNASETVGRALKKGDYVVYESTVYPGCTEDDCVPVLERVSGLKMGEDFKIGYSPERINPGDKVRTLTTILKIVSGSDSEALRNIAGLYESIITVEPAVHLAPSIKVAEAAKIIENTQRDLNISLMNELSIIFDKLGINTNDVLKAAGTKWNFLHFFPGLVGGHCIGVDPYYLLHKAREIGYDPQVILSGRRVNDGMPFYIAKKLTQLILQVDKHPKQAKILILGITFKENVSDIRNSKVAELAKAIEDYSMTVHVYDPHASAKEVKDVYGIDLIDEIKDDYDGIVVAVNHIEFNELDAQFFNSKMKANPILMDLKSIYSPLEMEAKGLTYWSL